MPDNATFYHLAYVIATAIFVGYAGLIEVRRRRIRTIKGRTGEA